jgi:hypothetical protein
MGLTLDDMTLKRGGTNVNLPVEAQLTSGDGITWTLSGLSSAQGLDGDYELTLGTGVQDLATNDLAGAVSESWTMDRVLPIVTISIDASSRLDTTPELNGTVNDPDAEVVITVGGNSFTAVNHGATWTLPNNTITPPLPDGIYDVLVTATDVAGNAGTDSTTNELNIDGVPVVTIDALITSITSPELTGTVNESTATLSLTLNGSTYVPLNNGNGTWRLPADRIIPPLAEGTYDVAITATDVTNHVGSDTTTDELTIGSTILISEFMADTEAKDVGGFVPNRDYYYQSSDWIELYNFGSLPIDLTDWSLTDSDGNLGKWRFPAPLPGDSAIVIPAQGRLVVFASERNEVAPNGELHTNFKLNNGGEYLALVRPDGQVIHEFAPEYPKQFENISYGFAGDGKTVGFMQSPTPGTPNAAVFDAVSIKPTMTKTDGTPVSTHLFTDNFSIELSSPELGAVIHYTTNGSIPTASSPVASGPIGISTSTQLRAISIAPGQINSGVRVEEFFKVDAGTAAFTSTLPILIVDAFGTIGARVNGVDNAQVEGHMAFFEPNGTTGLASLSDVPTSSSRIGIKVRGSSSAGFAKRPYSLELFEDTLNDDRNISLAGLPAESDWAMQGPYTFDRSFTRNSFIYELSRQVGVYAARTQLIEVFVNQEVNNQSDGIITGGGNSTADYVGIYVLIEKIKPGEDRVDVGGDVSPNFPLIPVALDGDGNLLQGDVTGGYMFKVDRLDRDPEPGQPADTGFSAAGQTFGYVYPKEIVIKTPAWDNAEKYLTNYLNAFGAALNASNFTHPTLGLHYSEFIDVQSFVDHHILNELMWNVDAFRLSTYYKKVKNGKIQAEPIWDFDRSAESEDGRDNNPRTWYSSRFFGWWNRLLNQDPDFAQAWIDRWAEWRRDEFSNENLLAVNNFFGEQVVPDPDNPSVGPASRDETRWDRDARNNGGFASGELNGTVQGEINHMNAWLEARVEWIDGKFLVAPVFSNAGGEIAPGFTLDMDTSRGAIFYTLDGSDPRAPGGGVSASAFEYDATNPADIARRRLDQNTVVTARVFDSTFASDFSSVSGGEHWSGLTSGIFTVDKPTITITEVNYNPQNSTDEEIAAGFADEDLFEFVEVHNFGTQPINTAGIQFTNGISFDFSESSVSSIAPGDYIVVVRNEAAFKHRYSSVSANRIAGEFSGALRNSGERLALENQFSQELANFNFEDGWYDITDGDGFTLSRRDDADSFADLDLKRAWRPSSKLLGSPGTFDPMTQPNPGAIVINEILTHTDDSTSGDWIELLNTTSEPIDIGGWYLSDEGDNLRKFRFPDGTEIGAGQFLVIDQIGQNGEVGFGDNRVDVVTNPNGNPGAFGLSELGDTIRLTAVDPDRIRENIDAAHVLPGGNLLISTGGAAVLGDNAFAFGNGDLIEYDPVTGEAALFFSERTFLEFDPIGMTFISGGNEDVVAVSIDPTNGHLILSTDGPAVLPGEAGTPQVIDGVLSFGNGDLVSFDLSTRTATLLLSESVFADGNANIDAVHVLGDGSLIISTGGAESIVGDDTQTVFDDGDLIEIIPGNNANLSAGDLGDNPTVRLFVSESIFAIDAGNLEPTEDVDAVYVAASGAITLSTNGDATFASPLDLAFLNGDLVELTPGAGSDLGAVPADFGPGASVRLVFEENPAGSTTFLGEVAGYREQASFGAAEREVTFGLHLKSDGTTDFTALIPALIPELSTKGSANEAPLVGPVVINEIMYNPVLGEVEYIELLNISGTAFSLFDAANPTNTWQFTNGINFAFPTDVTLDAGAHVLVLPSPPRQFADFAAFEADFRANHNVPAAVEIFGPYVGSLSNAGEALELSKPGNPEPNGTVPLILVDRVRYDDRLPWPVLADGLRSSLSRKDATAYGSDAINWAPSTTDGTPGRTNISLDNSPPTVPANLQAVVNSESRITVTWSASSDPETGVSFYRVLRNGLVVEPNFNGTTYVDTDVAPNVTFSYEVSAVNADAFESSLSVSLPVNILAVPTTEATEVTQVKLIFDTVLESSSATNTSNYIITGPNAVTVTGASVDAEGRTVTLFTTQLLEGSRYVVAIENVVASTPGSQLPINTQVNVDVPDLTLPTITAVQLRGSNWSPELLDRLEANGQGENGLDVPTGPDQLKTITWAGVDTVIIHFSEHVIVSEGDLVITGVNTVGYPSSGFQYDAGTFTATWTLPGAIVADRLVLNLKDSVHDPGNNAIDGNWSDGSSSFPSGNNQRESNDHFQFRLNVLPGDVDGNNTVGRGDIVAALRLIGRDTTDANYDARVDITADGQIDINDLRGILLRNSSRLPSGDPSPTNSLPIVATDTVFSRLGGGGSPPGAIADMPLESTTPQAIEGRGSRRATQRSAVSDSNVVQPLSRRSVSGRRARRLSQAAVDAAIVEPVENDLLSPAAVRSRAAGRRDR